MKRGYGIGWNCFFLLLVACPAVMLVFFRIFITDWVSAPFSEQARPHWRTNLAFFAPLILLGGGLASLLVVNVFLPPGAACTTRCWSAWPAPP